MIGNGKYMFNYLFEPIIFSAEKNILKSFMRLGVNLVVDGTNVSKFIRGKFIRLAKANNYKVTAIVFPRIKKETAIRRRMKSNHGDKDAKGWERIWEMFDEAYEKPSKKEGFSAIQYVKK
jgi:predicted kinase